MFSPKGVEVCKRMSFKELSGNGRSIVERKCKHRSDREWPGELKWRATGRSYFGNGRLVGAR